MRQRAEKIAIRTKMARRLGVGTSAMELAIMRKNSEEENCHGICPREP
jgi:hypothetical protein